MRGRDLAQGVAEVRYESVQEEGERSQHSDQGKGKHVAHKSMPCDEREEGSNASLVAAVVTSVSIPVKEERQRQRAYPVITKRYLSLSLVTIDPRPFPTKRNSHTLPSLSSPLRSGSPHKNSAPTPCLPTFLPHSLKLTRHPRPT